MRFKRGADELKTISRIEIKKIDKGRLSKKWEGGLRRGKILKTIVEAGGTAGRVVVKFSAKRGSEPVEITSSWGRKGGGPGPKNTRGLKEVS